MFVRNVLDNEKTRWNEFVRREPDGSFLQSWEWGEFMATQKDRIFRLAVEESGEWLALLFLFQSGLKFGQRIFYAPRGPVCGATVQDLRLKIKVVRSFLEHIGDLAARDGVMYWQIDAPSGDEYWPEIFNELDLVKAERDIQPRHTLILDIRKSEEDLLAQMHQKTRYNINVARKQQVEIVVDNSAFKEFYELLKDTEARQKIKLFGPDYFKNILRLPIVKLYLAKLQGRIVAANIMVFWHDTATYLFGAADYRFRSAMAPYLLQWQAMKDAKEAGGWFYDFWGAAPKNVQGREENWAGFTRFKMGFSPNAELTEYAGTYEILYQPVKTGIYRFLQKFYH